MLVMPQINHGERQRHVGQVGVFCGARPRLPRQHQRMLTQANLKQLGIMSGTSPLQHGHEIIHIAGGEKVLGVAGGLVPEVASCQKIRSSTMRSGASSPSGSW